MCVCVQEVIPLLKENMSSVCSSELLQQIRQLVVSLVLAQEKEQVSAEQCCVMYVQLVVVSLNFTH